LFKKQDLIFLDGDFPPKTGNEEEREASKKKNKKTTPTRRRRTKQEEEEKTKSKHKKHTTHTTHHSLHSTTFHSQNYVRIEKIVVAVKSVVSSSRTRN
jgi:hypothetical protein